MSYDILISNEEVGSGLSFGELSQWILELTDELNVDDKISFQSELGFSEGNYENFIYEYEYRLPLNLKFGSQDLLIKESEF